MRRYPAGFTLIELLVVIGILSVLAVMLLPKLLEGQREANIAADAANMRNFHFQNFMTMKNRKVRLPKGGGHKFVLAAWIEGVCDKTQENRDRFFTPGQEQDPHWQDLRDLDVAEIWSSYDDVTSEDTHYAGRAAKYYRSMWSTGNEALLSTDNEFGNVFADGTINVLMASGTVRPLYKASDLKEYWDEADSDFFIEVGPDSPVPELQKLEK